MQYKYKPLHNKLKKKIKAVDILYKKMMFYDGEAQSLIVKIVEQLKLGASARGDKMSDMFKAIMRCNDLVIECATKLAPYQDPKLANIEVKKTTTNRFVLVAPRPINDKLSWLQEVQQQALPPPKFLTREDHIIDIPPRNIEDDDDYELKQINGRGT